MGRGGGENPVYRPTLGQGKTRKGKTDFPFVIIKVWLQTPIVI